MATSPPARQQGQASPSTAASLLELQRHQLRPGGRGASGSRAGLGSHLAQTSSPSTSCLPLHTSDRHYTNQLQRRLRNTDRVNDLTPGSFLMTQGLQWAARDKGEGYSMTLLPPDGEGPKWLPEVPRGSIIDRQIGYLFAMRTQPFQRWDCTIAH